MSGQKKMKVAVLMGGISSEHDISLSSGKGVMYALKRMGYSAKEIIVGEDLSKLIMDLKHFKPDVVLMRCMEKVGKMVVFKGCLIG